VPDHPESGASIGVDRDGVQRMGRVSERGIRHPAMLKAFQISIVLFPLLFRE